MYDLEWSFSSRSCLKGITVSYKLLFNKLDSRGIVLYLARNAWGKDRSL